MKVRLIQPSQLDARGTPVRFKQLFFPNLTLPTLAGLTPDDVDISLTTEYVESVDFEERTDLVALTAQTCQAPRAYQIADEFRSRGIQTIMGGIHASVCPEEALRHVDTVAIGEAEGIWEQILHDAERGQLKRIYQQEQKPDLTRLSIPRFDLLNYKHYVVPPLAKTPLIPIQTSRGCPNHCDFCSVARFFGHKMRHKPIERVLQEIDAIQPSRVFFTDDNIGANPVYAKELFQALKPLKLRWACQMSTQIMHDPELIEMAGEAGCHETLLGLESINPQSLKNMHKSFNKQVDYQALLKRLKDAGILAQVSVIFGLDEDTPDSLERTIDTLLEWDTNYIYIAILTPFPGTPLYTRMASHGRLTCDDWSMYDVTQVVFTPQLMKADALESCMWDMFRKCYSTSNIFKRVWRFRKEYIHYFPKDNAIEEMYLQFHMQHSVKNGCHPFSLGLAEKHD